jgi:phosphoribosylaminoimidazolecarboxamide formyltransferase / IMP cyclohydrolase
MAAHCLTASNASGTIAVVLSFRTGRVPHCYLRTISMSQNPQRRALVSVSDKTDLADFVQGLVELGFEILSTGGTRKFLEGQGVAVTDVSSYTGFPEIMDGRVKTLHPKIHGAILGRPDLPDDAAAIATHGIVPLELVVCNLYPFEETIAKPGVTVPEAIEQIDIGGPSMIRSAAKNHAYVAVVTNSGQYAQVLGALKIGSLDEQLRRELAAAAFEMTARYDRAIADYMTSLTAGGGGEQLDTGGEFPPALDLQFKLATPLRYGENPHQRAAFYVEPHAAPATLASARQLHGKELSYNNLLDLDSALSLVREFSAPAAVVIKHNNPCGCGIAGSLAEAFERAYAGDPVSAFGSILGFNRPVDLATAEQLCEPNRFVEAIIAPGYDDAAFDALTTRPKWRKNVRLMICEALGQAGGAGFDYRRVTGGLLVQDRDEQADLIDEWKTVTDREPTPGELDDLQFAWSVCKHVRSNAIVFAKAGAVVGVGAGQMSRLDSAHIAAYKAGERSTGGVVASDAFFPFRDGIDEAATAGITAVIQPGGSRGDDECITACNEHGMAMIFTGRRHFKH